MATLGTLIVKLTADVSEYEKKLESTTKKMTDVGKKMTSIGKGMTAGVTLPLLGLGTVAVMAASNLEESMNKVGVVFGDSADAVVGFSSTASTSLGMSQQQALEAAGTFGNLFTAMEIGQPVAADMSTNLLTLAADLASFNNMDPTEVLEKLRSGLVGEVEPLRTLGVNLSAAAVEAKAMELGLADAEGELSAAALAQARYALILEQTTNAQGDFARTSDGLANQMRIVKAQFGDAAASLGTLLLPYVQKFVTWIGELIGKFQALSPGVQKAIVIFGVIAAAIGPVLMIVGSLVSAIGTILPVIGAVVGILSGPVLLVIGLIVGAIALLRAAWVNNWGGIQEKTAAVVEWIKGVISAFLAGVQAWWAAHGEQVMATVSALWNGIVSIISGVVNAIMSVVSGVLNAIQGFWNQHGAAITAAAQAAWGLIQEIISGVLDILSSVFAAWKSAFQGDWTAFGQNLRAVWDKTWKLVVAILQTVGKQILTVIVTLARNMVQKFKDINWSQVGRDLIAGIVRGIQSGAINVINAIKKVAEAAWKAITAFFGSKSPSRLMINFGRTDLMGAWATGIEQGAWMPEGAMIKAGGRVERAITNNHNLTIYTNSPTERIVDDFNVMRSWSRA